MYGVNDYINFNNELGIVAAISGIGTDEPYYYVWFTTHGDWLSEKEILNN